MKEGTEILFTLHPSLCILLKHRTIPVHKTTPSFNFRSTSSYINYTIKKLEMTGLGPNTVQNKCKDHLTLTNSDKPVIVRQTYSFDSLSHVDKRLPERRFSVFERYCPQGG